MPESRTAPSGGDRLAKVMARSGLCSRRDAEEWIKNGRVTVNGKIVKTPAFNVTDADKVVVDGAPLAARQGTRVWLYHKPAGLMVTEKDPEGRPTVFEKLDELGLPRVVSIGRLDFNTEGLLLVTNDGGLKRVLELPATGWLRKYRVRAHGSITQAQLDKLKNGVEVDGVKYGPIEATLEREQGANVWMQVSLREGKNREVKNVLFSLGLEVNRLIRVSYGPFQLADIPIGGIETVKAKVLKDQLGKRLADEAEVDFDSELPERDMTGPGGGERQFGRGTNTAIIAQQRFRFTDRPDRAPGEVRDNEPAPRRTHRPGGRDEGRPERPRAPERKPRDDDAFPPRQIHFDDGREPAVFEAKSYGKKDRKSDDDEPRTPRVPRAGVGDRPARALKPAGKVGDRAKRDFGDRPARPAGDRPFSARPPRADGDSPRPARSFGDKPRSPRPAGDRPFSARPPRADGDSPRPARSFSDKPRSPRPAGDRPFSARPPRADGDSPRPARSFSDKPRSPRPSGDRPFSARPPRADGDSPRPARSFSDKPRSPRPAGDRPFSARPPRADGDSPRPARSFNDKPRSPRPAGDRPFSARPPRADGDSPRPARSFSDKPRSPRPAGDRPFSARPPRADGDRPRSPRPAGAEGRPPRSPGSSPRPPRPTGDRPRPPRDGAPKGPRKPRS
ncbi:MAG TPA: pseudouridine synthase [Arsenicitalea sp.]|jgi:23S rRNA pseudouridine2605 synthase|nr:pseudouridine synthase [Arsenicitalea sp.]